jgi:DNA polymerase-3 subunit epsilon
MLLIGIDFETTGMSPEKHAVIEVGAILWDTDLRAPIRVIGYLVNPRKDCEWDPEAMAKNGLSQELCQKYGYEDERALKQLLVWYQQAEIACAHNGTKFDRPFFSAWCAHYGYDDQPKKLWIDTDTDIDFSRGQSHHLDYMAADHRFLNPFPHRAVFDVMTMLKIMDEHDCAKIIESAKEPKIIVQALVSFENNNLARVRNYRPHYEDGRFKAWLKTINQRDYAKEAEEAGFPVRIFKS